MTEFLILVAVWCGNPGTPSGHSSAGFLSQEQVQSCRNNFVVCVGNTMTDERIRECALKRQVGK